MSPDELAQRFHEAYERLAPSFGYETRRESAVPWEEVPENNRRLMTATAAVAMQPLASRIEELEKGLRAIEPWKLREIAEWFDLIDKLLDKLEVNGAPFREQYAMPRKSDIQDDLRSWAETVEALVGAALGGEDG